MSFEVGDYVEHFKLPHIWRITKIDEGKLLKGKFATLELFWTPSNWEEAPPFVWSVSSTLYDDIVKSNYGMSLKDLRTPSNEMLVIALECSR